MARIDDKEPQAYHPMRQSLLESFLIRIKLGSHVFSACTERPIKVIRNLLCEFNSNQLCSTILYTVLVLYYYYLFSQLLLSYFLFFCTFILALLLLVSHLFLNSLFLVVSMILLLGPENFQIICADLCVNVSIISCYNLYIHTR